MNPYHSIAQAFDSLSQHVVFRDESQYREFLVHLTVIRDAADTMDLNSLGAPTPSTAESKSIGGESLSPGDSANSDTGEDSAAESSPVSTADTTEVVAQ